MQLGAKLCCTGKRPRLGALGLFWLHGHIHGILAEAGTSAMSANASEFVAKLSLEVASLI